MDLSSSEQIPSDRTDRPQIAPLVDALPLTERLFGRNEAGRPQHVPCARDVKPIRVLPQTRDAEVKYA